MNTKLLEDAVKVPGLDFENILKQLTEREARILELRYGLLDDQPRTLKELADIFGVTPERIRQIEAKAIKKIRARAHINRLNKEARKPLYDPNAKYQKGDLNAPIEVLDMSVRSYNCLKRAGYDTVEQLTKASFEQLMMVKNLGKRSYKEVITKLTDWIC